MNAEALTCTVSCKKRPWWRPFSFRAARRWYQKTEQYSHERSRFFRLLAALYLGRRELSIGEKITIP